MRRLLTALLLLAASAGTAAAQDGTGVIHGTVTDRAHHGPIVQVVVRADLGGRSVAAATDTAGRYLLSGIPPGAWRVEASRIGFRSHTAEVVMPAELQAELNFVLTEVTRGLVSENPRPRAEPPFFEAVPVAAVDSIIPDSARAAVRTFSELLDARAAGLVVRGSSGTVGAGSRVRLRGSSSFFLPNYPLVVIDGVRAITDPHALRMDVGGQTPSTLDDLAPEEVASVRVLRGPAAAAAYGPAGAAGVLEVTTLRGTRGPPRWRAWAEMGMRQEPDGFPANFDQAGITPAGTRGNRCTLRAQAAGLCTPVDGIAQFSPLRAFSPFEGGERRAGGAAVRGGLPFLDYAVSGEWSRDLGLLRENDGGGASFRGSFGVRPAQGVTVRLDLAHAARDLRLPMEGNSTQDVLGSGLTGAARDNAQHGYRDGLGPQNDFYENAQRVRRASAALAAEWRPLRWLRLGGRFGFDRRDADDRQRTQPVGPQGGAPQQRLAMTDRELRDGQLRATAAVRLGGVDGVTTVEWQRLTDRAGLDDSLAVFGLGGLRFIDRHLYRDHALAWRQALDWRETVHLGAVLRRDVPGVGRPLVSGSLGAAWDVGAEPFFPAATWLDRLTLRAAYGSTPRTFATLPGIGSPTEDFCAAAPCTGTDAAERLREVEAGADASLFAGRVALSVTGYRRSTRGLLIPIAIAQDGSLRLTTDGAVRNTGAELSLRATLLHGGAVQWEMDMLGAANHNRVTSLDASFYVLGEGVDQYLMRGRPIGAYFASPVVSADDRDGDGVITAAACPGAGCEVVLADSLAFAGSPEPTRMLALASRVTLGRRVTLYARAEHQGGSTVLNYIHGVRCLTYLRCRELYDAAAGRDAQVAVAAAQLGSRVGYFEDSGFLKLREAAVTVAAPEGWARSFGARAVSLTLAGRNLATSTRYSGLDPETSSFGQDFSTLDLAQMPLPRTWVTRVEVRF